MRPAPQDSAEAFVGGAREALGSLSAEEQLTKMRSLMAALKSAAPDEVKRAESSVEMLLCLGCSRDEAEAAFLGRMRAAGARIARKTYGLGGSNAFA